MDRDDRLPFAARIRRRCVETSTRSRTNERTNERTDGRTDGDASRRPMIRGDEEDGDEVTATTR